MRGFVHDVQHRPLVQVQDVDSDNVVEAQIVSSNRKEKSPWTPCVLLAGGALLGNSLDIPKPCLFDV
jgi:hypothetical protein